MPTVDLGDSIEATDVDFVSRMSTVVATVFKDKYGLRFGDVSVDQLALEVQAMLNSLLPDRIPLSRSRPDFDSVLFALMRALEGSNAWRDTTIASTGQMILRAVATDVEYAQLSIMRALQEAFPHSARNPSSILAAARGLGVRIQRNQPAHVTCRLARATDTGVILQVPAWSTFAGEDGSQWFNRRPISFDAGDLTVDATLHEGTISSTEVISTGLPLMVIEVGTESDTISDLDLRVFVDDVEWTKTEGALWNMKPESRVFWEQSLPSGNVEVRFGDGSYGAVPTSGSTVRVEWVETIGSEAHLLAPTGTSVTWSDALSGINLENTVVLAPSGGQDRLSVNYYRVFAGVRRAADAGNSRRAVTRPDWRAHACTYPGVFDAIVRGQAEIAPTNRFWTNVIGVTLLTDPVFTEVQWRDFTDFLYGNNGYPPLVSRHLELVRMDPTVVTMDVKATVFCRIDADRESVRTRLVQNIKRAMSPRIGSLGFSFYLSDLIDLLKGHPPGNLFRHLREDDSSPLAGSYDLPSVISYVQVERPTDDAVVDTVLQWVRPGSIEVDVKYASQRRGGYEGYASGLESTV